jgi:hypothetical protein
MAAGNCIAFPVYEQAFRVYFVMLNSLTGLPITGGLSTLVCEKSDDGGAFALTGAPVESPANSGFGYVDLTASEMTANNIALNITCTNTNAFCPPVFIVPLQLAEESGCSLDQTLLLLEQMIRDLVEVTYNDGSYNGSVQVLLNRAGNANLCTRTVSGSPGNGGTGVAGNLQ